MLSDPHDRDVAALHQAVEVLEADAQQRAEILRGQKRLERLGFCRIMERAPGRHHTMMTVRLVATQDRVACVTGTRPCRHVRRDKGTPRPSGQHQCGRGGYVREVAAGSRLSATAFFSATMKSRFQVGLMSSTSEGPIQRIAPL